MIKKKLIAIAILFISAYVFAGVNPKNGNFWVSYTDIVLENHKSGFSEVVRTYNSAASGLGLFGYGWSSNLETRLFTYPDGTLLIKERGLGASSYYKSDLTLDFMLDNMIEQLIELSLAEGDLENSPNLILKRRDKLTNNLEYRIGQWDKYVKKGLLNYKTDFPAGMQWLSHQYGNSILDRTEQGFIRKQNRIIEEFDLNGNMTKYVNSKGDYSVMEYVNNKIVKIVNADGSELVFDTNENGYITEINFENKKALYKYYDTDLIESSDFIGNLFTHTYDKNHNMTSIGYQDDSKRVMEYYRRNSKIKSDTDRDGFKKEYEYLVFYKEDGSIDIDHFGTTISFQDYEGKRTNTYEYVIGVKENGERYNKIYKTIRNGVSSETHYDELCDKPILKKRGTLQTIFNYNNRCLIVQKLNKSDSIYLKYHPDFDKITYVKNKNGITEFKYNEKQLLTAAKKSDGSWMKLEYSEIEEIETIKLKDKTIKYTYNTSGKPKKIEILNVGTINVIYNEVDEIVLDDYSDEEYNIYVQAMQAFSTIMEFVKPAGVNLEM